MTTTANSMVPDVVVVGSSAAGATGLVWVADSAVPFAVGDVLVVRSPETNGTAQVVLKAE